MPKKLPMRQCVACRQMRMKKDMIRVVKSPEGEISLDFNGKKPGRGAYLCKDIACLEKAKKTKALQRGFDTLIADEIYDALKDELEAEYG